MTDHGHVWVASAPFAPARCKRCGISIDSDEPETCPVNDAIESAREAIERLAGISVHAAHKAALHQQKLGIIRGFNLAMLHPDRAHALKALREALGEEFWNAHKKSIRGG